MKVIHFSYMDNGGAGTAAVRYHKLMQEMGIDSTLYVRKKTLDDDSIVALKSCTMKRCTSDSARHLLKEAVTRLIGLLTGHSKEPYCFFDFAGTCKKGLVPDLINKIDCKGIDFVFVHWLGNFINSYDLVHLYNATRAKFVFSMMDLEAVTGGCHYPWQCKKYQVNCIDCPALPVATNILAHNQLMAKVANYAYTDADIFSSSLYDLEVAKKSIVPFNKYWHLYYPIDENIFKPEKERVQSGEITLFSNVNNIDDPKKGFNYLLAILLSIDKKTTRKIRFLCLPNRNYRNYDFKNITFEEFSFCKSVNDLVPLYQKTDIFLCCSIEDSSPMMLQEALLCGVPAISFDTGIGRQLIEDGKHGYVVPRYDIKGFEEKLLTMISGKSSTIASPKEIHEHLVSICGKEVVKGRLKEILSIRTYA